MFGFSPLGSFRINIKIVRFCNGFGVYRVKTRRVEHGSVEFEKIKSRHDYRDNLAPDDFFNAFLCLLFS